MESIKRYIIAASLLTPSVMGSFSASAQQHSHQRNLLPGARAAALGGAFTALSNDPSGGYYNPAGIANAARSETSVSSNAYRVSKTVYTEAIDGEDFVETSNAIYPSFLGAIYKWGSLTGGWSYMTLDSKNINQNHRFENISSIENEASTYSRTHQEVNTYINAGASAAWKISKNLSLGGSLFYYRREIQSTNHQMTQFNGGALMVLDFKYNTVNEGFVPVGGLTWKGDQFSFGISGRTPTAYTDNTKYTSDRVVVTGPDTGGIRAEPSVAAKQGASSTLDEPNPNNTQIGAAWFPTSWFLISGDVLYHGAVDTGVEANNFHSTMNYSLGMELSMPLVAIRGGMFTNNSLYRAPKTDKSDQPTWINFLGTTAGLGITQKDREGSITVVQQSGTGKAQIITGTTDIQTVKTTSTTYMVTGTVFF